MSKFSRFFLFLSLLQLFFAQEGKAQSSPSLHLEAASLSRAIKGTLKERLIRARPGDFVVTAQGGHYSLMIVRELRGALITLEEVSIERTKISLSQMNWKQWIEKKAPEASSWIAVTLDVEHDRIIQCYSYLEKQWVLVQEAEPLLVKLLSLSLRPTQEKERKRIGPPPQEREGEMDRRKIWIPQMTREGKTIKHPRFEVVRATWPKDGSYLAGSIIEFYLDEENPSFPFPYWLEVESPHYTFKLRTIDSGRDLQSPMPSLHPFGKASP